MASAEVATREREEIREMLGGLLVDEATLVPPEQGWLAGRRHTHRRKAIASVRSLLERALASGERIRFVTLGIRYNALEIYFQGAFAQLNNRYVLILTSERLLTLQVHGARFKAGDIKNDIPLAAIESAKGRVLTLKLRDGKKVRFSGIAGPDRKHLTKLLAGAADTAAASSAGMRHLCPGCLKVIPGLAGNTLQCPNDACRIPLRSASQAAWMSAFVPGVGDLYLRHFFTGFQEFFGSLLGLLILAIAAVFALYVPSPETPWILGLIFGGFVVLPRIVDYPLTLFMARKGNVPLSYQSPVLPVGHALPSGTPAEPLPVFPKWVIGMFALGVLALLGTISATQPAAQASAHVYSAVDAVAANHLDQADDHWRDAESSGWVDANDRARLALAYLQADLPERAAPLIDAIGDTEVDWELAEAINAILAAPVEEVEGEGVELEEMELDEAELEEADLEGAEAEEAEAAEGPADQP